MNAVEIMRRYARDVDGLAQRIRSGEIGSVEETEVQLRIAQDYALTYEHWASCLQMAAHLLEMEVDTKSERYMGIGIDNWTGLKDKDGDNFNFGDIALLEVGGGKVYYHIEWLQDEFFSKIVKVSGNSKTDLGVVGAAKLKRIGPGKNHPELMEQIRGED